MPWGKNDHMLFFVYNSRDSFNNRLKIISLKANDLNFNI